jgi:hypothetical protein
VFKSNLVLENFFLSNFLYGFSQSVDGSAETCNIYVILIFICNHIPYPVHRAPNREVVHNVCS